MRHVTWREMADELIHGNWGTEAEDRRDYIIKHTAPTERDYLIIILLRDIAESLRVLRCQNFKEIPWVLKGIKRNTHKPKKCRAKIK